MKGLYIVGAVCFIIITLGFVDVGMKFTDGTSFTYRGWNHYILD